MASDTNIPPDRSDLKVEKIDKICRICSVSLRGVNLRKSGIKCANEKCDVVMHVKCFDLVSKVFGVKKNNWYCGNCSKSTDVVSIVNSCSLANCDESLLHKEIECLKRENDLLVDLVEELKYSNKLQKEQLEAASTKTVSTFSAHDKQPTPQMALYSTALKSVNVNRQHSSAVLFVKSTDENTNVMKEVCNNVNPNELNIRVNNTRPIKGGILINCENNDSLDKLKRAVKDKFGDRLSVSVPNKFNPRILLSNVTKDLNCTNQQLVEDIKMNNPELQEILSEDSIKVVTKLTRKFSQSIVLEVSPALRNKIISTGFLYIKWQRCTVADYYNVTRCFRCSRYGHVRKDCKQPNPTCKTCGGDHESQECNNSQQSRCINCCNFNARKKGNGIDVSVDHVASDYNSCYYYKYQLDILKSKISYGE